MGIIGRAFGNLFNFLGSLFSGLFGVIWDAVKWIVDALVILLQSLLNPILIFFEAIYGLIAGLLHLLFMIGVLAVKLFQVIFEAAKILWSLIVGFGKTLASLSYTPKSTGGHGYSKMIGDLFSNLEVLQINSVAYILLFLLWFMTAISAIKLISSIRVGGD